MPSSPPASRIEGSLFGMAYGDALGAPTEFIRSVEAIEARFGPGGPDTPPGPVFRVTDDTQMALALGQALLAHLSETPPIDNAHFERALRERFVDWFHDPENNRAPGNTCLRACEALDDGQPWLQATQKGSKGCGANMRVMPLGLSCLSPTSLAELAQLQAAMTHGHPTALTASELTAQICSWLARDTLQPEKLLQACLDLCQRSRELYHHDILLDLWELTLHPSPEAYISRGWDECAKALTPIEQALQARPHEHDPCKLVGEGWVAEEALAAGLLCFLWYPDEPLRAIRRAANSCGDSDSIACIAGSFAGAHLGIDAWPSSWRQAIEYGDQLEQLARGLTQGSGTAR